MYEQNRFNINLITFCYLCVSDLGKVVEESYTPKVTVHYATPLFNIKDWLAPHMAGLFKNHSMPLWFRFRSKDGITRMHYKMWVHDPWLPEERRGKDGIVTESTKGLICFKVEHSYMQLCI